MVVGKGRRVIIGSIGSFWPTTKRPTQLVVTGIELAAFALCCACTPAMYTQASATKTMVIPAILANLAFISHWTEFVGTLLLLPHGGLMVNFMCDGVRIGANEC